MLTSEFEYTYNGQGRKHPEQGTLKEIGAQVGDVVEYTAIGEPHFHSEVFTLAAWVDGLPYSECQEVGGDSSLRTDDAAKFRIISRANRADERPAPILTTRRIVNTCTIGNVEVTKSGKVWMRHVSNAEELTAAIETLTEIRNAMEDLS